MLFDDLENKLKKKKMQANERLSSLSEKLEEDVEKAKSKVSFAKDSISGKAKELSSSAKSEVSSTSDDLSSAMDNLSSKAKELSAGAADGSRRAMGFLKGQFISPKTEMESTLLSEKTWFLCSLCGDKLGPVKTSKWNKMKEGLKERFSKAKLATGAATSNPIWIASGTVDYASSDGDGDGFLGKIKKDRKQREKGKEFLLQCGYCGEWICSSCWSDEKNRCVKCAGNV